MKKENTKWENENIKIFLFGDLNELMTKYRRENLFVISNIVTIHMFIYSYYIHMYMNYTYKNIIIGIYIYEMRK